MDVFSRQEGSKGFFQVNHIHIVSNIFCELKKLMNNNYSGQYTSLRRLSGFWTLGSWQR